MGIRKWKNDLVRFNVEFGPPSLFERVEYKMKDVHTLHMNGPHFNARLSDRNIPEEVKEHIINFNTDEWHLVTAEVRREKGKFYNSTWEYCCDGCAYWVTIGLGECVMTIVRKESSGVEKCIRDGEYYDFVEEVNRKLMDEDMKQKNYNGN